MATRKFSNSGDLACDPVAAVKIAYKGDRASFRGTADELIEAGIIMPEWIPQAPKRQTTSYQRSWWLHNYAEWDDRRCIDRDMARDWTLVRLADGRLKLTVCAARFRHFLGGPIDEDSGRRAAARHIALVRAESDAAFRRFLKAAGF